MRRISLVLLVALVAHISVAQESIETADQLFLEERHVEGYEFLLSAVEETSSRSEQAELYWRLARVTLEVGDIDEQQGASESQLLRRFEEGESYAERSIALDPEAHEGYYWKSANTGRWGEVKGILNSLFKAKPMRNLLWDALRRYPDHAASFYVLGIMYERVPGGLVSFGNDNYAVSLGRKAVDANLAEFEAGVEHEVKIEYYTELARHLWERDWKASTRRREQDGKRERYEEEDDVLIRNFYYEGVVDIENMSDRDEALEMIKWVIDSFEALPELKKSEADDLAEAREIYDSWID